MNLTLVIGNKNYSSWSLRPWLALKHTGAPFREVRIPLYTAGYKEEVLKYSPSGKVPCLVDGRTVVWDSLAICEYLAERFPQAGLWPADRDARAVARAVSAEMHAGFSQVRTHMGMNARRRISGRPRPREVHEEIERIQEIWRTCRTQYGAAGPFLFGSFSIADAMYAPVVTRFVTYEVDVTPLTRRYMETVLALPAMQAWLADSRAEKERIEAYEV